MKTVITELPFPCEIKNKIKMKVSTGNLEINFLSGHLIKIDNTNISIEEPHRIIVKKDNMILLAMFYNNEDKIYLPNNNIFITLTKYISILNSINKI